MQTVDRKDVEKQIEAVFSEVQKQWTQERQRRVGVYRKLLLNAREELKDLGPQQDVHHKTILELIRSWNKDLREVVQEDHQTPANPKWLAMILEQLSSLPDEVELLQKEERFYPQKDDGVWKSTLKTLKRYRRWVQKHRNKAVNGFRGLVGADKVTLKAWSHRVPVQAIAKHQVVASEQEWIGEIHHDWYVLASFLRDLEHWQDDWLAGTNVQFSGTEHIYDRISDAQESLNGLAELLDRQIEALQHLQQNIASSVQQLVDDWKQNVLTRTNVVNTIEHTGAYNEEKVSSRKLALTEVVKTSDGKWSTICLRLLDEITLYHELLQYGYRVDQEAEQLNNFIDSQINKSWIEPVDQALKLMIEAYQNIRESKGAQLWSGEKDRILDYIDNQLIAGVDQNRIADDLTQRLNQYNANIQLSIRSLPEKSTVFSELNLDQEKPDYKLINVPLREWATRQVQQNLVLKLEVLSKYWSEAEIQLVSEAREIREIVAVNMASAIEGEQREEMSDPESQTMLLEGLERALTKIEKLRGDVEYERQRSHFNVLGRSTETVWSMLEWVGKDQLDEFKRSDRSSQVKEVTANWQTRLNANWARVLDRLSVWARWTWMRLVKVAQVVAPWLGFEVESETVGEKRKLDITAYLNETDEKINQLPYVYRKIFSLEATAEQRFYVQQGDLLPRFEKAYHNWLNGFSTNAAMVGERGSGKTTLIQVIQERYIAEQNAVTINLNQTVWKPKPMLEHIAEALDLPIPDSVDDLVNAIRDRDDQVINVVLVEGLQNTYLRHINGYDAIRDLLLLISKTRRSIFWITSCSRYAWYFLSKAVSIDDYFSVVLETDTLDRKQIQQLIMDRHKVSGYDLWFTPAEGIPNSRAFKKVMDSPEKMQEYLKNQFFEKLAQISEGNASIAMLFWLRSIKKIEETRLVLNPIEITQLDAIDAMKPETLFSLAAMILHDNMNAPELATSQHISLPKAEMILGRLATLGLINANNAEEREYWVMNPLVYRQTIRALRQRNIIHG